MHAVVFEDVDSKKLRLWMPKKKTVKRIKIKYRFCKRYGHMIKECKYNNLAKNNKVNVESCIKLKEEKSVDD